METILIDEKDYCSRFEHKAFSLRNTGDKYVANLEQEQGINFNFYIHELGNVYWMQDCDLDTNVTYLLKLCRDNYMRGMSAFSQQLKAERERNILRLFIEKAGMKEAFLLFEKQANELLTIN